MHGAYNVELLFTSYIVRQVEGEPTGYWEITTLFPVSVSEIY